MTGTVQIQSVQKPEFHRATASHDATVKAQLDSFLIAPAKFLLISIRKGLGPFSKLPVSLIRATLMFLDVDTIQN